MPSLSPGEEGQVSPSERVSYAEEGQVSPSERVSYAKCGTKKHQCLKVEVGVLTTLMMVTWLVTLTCTKGKILSSSDRPVCFLSTKFSQNQSVIITNYTGYSDLR